jgi:hypothetical protein
MISKLMCSIVLGGVFLLVGQGVADAQAVRTWVSGVGDDANPCSRTAPCKTFAGAISKTQANGEISVLDPGGYGSVTITKAISIVARGAEGAITACGVNGININAGVNDIVNIDSLIIEGCLTGVYGIRVIQAKAVHIRNTMIRGFGVVNSSMGIRVEGAAKVYIEDSDLSKNDRAIVALGTSQVILNRVAVNNNTGYGFRANVAGTQIIAHNSMISGNLVGVSEGGTGEHVSMGTNAFSANGTDGNFDVTRPRK